MGYVHLRYVYSVYECPHEVDKCYVLYEGVHIILCLSSHPIGNYYGKGQVRRKELYTSASSLVSDPSMSRSLMMLAYQMTPPPSGP